MIKNIKSFANKFLLIMALFIFLIFSLTYNCFASTTISFDDYDGISRSFTLHEDCSDFDYIIFTYYYINKYTLGTQLTLNFIKSNEELYFYKSPYSAYLKSPSDTSFEYYNLSFNFEKSFTEEEVNNSLNKLSSSPYTFTFDGKPNNSTSDGAVISTSPNTMIFAYSNKNIYDESGSLVFQSAPVGQVTIPGIQQVGEIPQMMEQVLKIIIPIGLIVFLIGLVIYLMRLVILRAQ